ncbi:MAG TPA: aldo/keto reductase, partial [Sunxiuqinia sp.]|nr:aldo/keto reductase [Sunxiuqinia sp.]
MIDSTVKLHNGVEMPRLGLGVFQSREGEEVINAVRFALQHGYRSIDTASIYQNEVGTGKGILESGIPREDIFLTSKVWNNQQGYKNTKGAFEQSLNRLQTDYLDLYLIHWPKGEQSVETWQALEELYDKGKIKAIGLSNFLIHHIEELLPHTKVKPMVNQVEFHPELVQPELITYCKEHGIQQEAWSPLMQGRVIDVPLLKELAGKYGKTNAQIALRWALQKGVVVIPKSVHEERIVSNADVFDFEITGGDMVKIDALDQGKRIGP